MIELQDGMLLYHGSYIGIPAIDLNRCFGGLDFWPRFLSYIFLRTSVQLRSTFG